MKSTIKKTTYVLLFFIFGAVASAQTGFHKLSVGPDLVVPLADLKLGYDSGYGASAKVFYGLDKKMSLTASVGYVYLPIKEFIFKGHSNFIPLMFGFDYDFGGFYVEPKLGVNFIQTTIKIDNSNESASDQEFTYGIGAGYRYASWDFNVSYNQISESGLDLGFIGVRAAYSINFKK